MKYLYEEIKWRIWKRIFILSPEIEKLYWRWDEIKEDSNQD